MQRSKIEWLKQPDGKQGYTWNPITGCSPVSEGCQACYAQALRKRFNGGDNSIQFHPGRLGEPRNIRKPSRIFVCSMGDFWHTDVEPIHRALIFSTVEKCTQHTFIFLTKRAKGMYLDLMGNTMMIPFEKLKNIWLGVTCENQTRADECISILRQIPAVVRFVSFEPLLDEIIVHNWTGISWAIVGPETGARRRPFDPAWARSLREQCKAAGVPFFYKGGLLDGVKYEEFP